MAISGRLLADVRIFPSGCSGLLEVDRIEARGVEGRTELLLPGCTAPLLLGSAERLVRQGSWSQLRGEYRSAAASMDATGLMSPRAAVQAWLPDRCQGLAAALPIPMVPSSGRCRCSCSISVPCRWLPWLRIISLPRCWRRSRCWPWSRLLVLVGPKAVLPLLLWPSHQLAGLVITMASWISHWPGAQHRTSPDVGRCPAGAGLAALVSVGRAL